MKRCFVRPQHLQAVADDQRESSLCSSDPSPAQTSSFMCSPNVADLLYGDAAPVAEYWDGAEPAGLPPIVLNVSIGCNSVLPICRFPIQESKWH